MNHVTRLAGSWLLTLAIATSAGAGGTLYVDDDALPGGDGTGWPTAYRFVQDALVDALHGGITEIHVAQGVYTPDTSDANPSGTGDREATFDLIDGIALRGGYRGAYDGTGMPPDDRDIDLFVSALSGDLLGDDGPGPFDNNSENSYTVVTGSGVSAASMLEGFTITAGNADGPIPGQLEWVRGAGMWNLGGSPTVMACRFVSNRALAHGGGMYNRDFSSPVVHECSFEGNEAIGGNAGALFNWNGSNATITQCEFVNNTSGDEGGAVQNSGCSPTFTGCNFMNNTTAHGGGAMMSRVSGVIIETCTFAGNSVDPGDLPSAGGALGLAFGNGWSVTACVFTGNTAFQGGAVTVQETVGIIADCLFAGNVAVGDEGGAVMSIDSSPTVSNTTIVANVAAQAGGGFCGFGLESNAQVSSCIIYGNAAPNDPQLVDVSGAITTLSYCNVEDGWAGPGAGPGIIDADPIFVDPDGPDDDPSTVEDNDYRVLLGSPCIDAGNNIAVPEGITTDLDGTPRFQNDLATADTGNGNCPIVDMGAYEFATTCPWDLDCNEAVGVTDLLALLAAWGTDPGGPHDFDGDGNVGVTDLLALLANWGPCP